ncbi:MAG: response regulator transcription factor [Eubacteriales bacterium]|nr:response regulator transcription factor [Christensenellaceae bacterium]MCI7583079.1 response regulator transcription factor [Christensenellaceae bacterium]MDY6077905.1 response regulator transcription factor [Eubacteriales bacterium]
MKNGKYSVMVVEDQQMPAQLFGQFISSSDRYELAVTIGCAALAEVYCMSYDVDLILMDVVTEDGASGIEAAEKIKKSHPEIKIIIVTSMPECSYIKRAKKAGAEGFWYKETSKEHILSIMDRVMSGEHVYPDSLQPARMGLASSAEFTERELEILREMTGGYSNQEIAEKLNISPNVVRNHITNMLEKTGFRSRTQLAVRARETGLVILERNEDEI